MGMGTRRRTTFLRAIAKMEPEHWKGWLFPYQPNLISIYEAIPTVGNHTLRYHVGINQRYLLFLVAPHLQNFFPVTCLCTETHLVTFGCQVETIWLV